MRSFIISRKRIAISVLTVTLGLMLITVGCGTIATQMVKHHDSKQPRDPNTGILLGAEARDLGDQSATKVAILVHGFAGSGNNFNELPQRLATAGWRVRVMRLPGHGTSPLDLEQVTAAQLIAAVTQEIACMRQQHDTVVLIGHSMGGALCTIAASQEPVDALVLGAAYFGVTYKWFYILPPETWSGLLSPCVRWVYKTDAYIQINRREMKDKILSYRWLPTKGTQTLIALGKRANAEETLRAIHCPVLMLHGPGDDAASFESAQRALKQMASNSKRFVRLERSNHHIFWDYDCETVNREIMEFLTGLHADST